MRALVVLFGGRLYPAAFGEFFSGKSAFSRALEGARRFPGAEELVLLGMAGAGYPGLPSSVRLLQEEAWTEKRFLEVLASLGTGFDLTYVAWADCPFLDGDLAGALAERHRRYGAEYSYADGWPYGFAPELLAPGTAGILAALAGEGTGPVERDSLFRVIQKDINAFDIETEISPVDLRAHRLSLAADSKAHVLLLRRLFEAGLSGAAGAAELIEGRPELLRTLPNFYPIQVSRPCPQDCGLCPYPRFRKLPPGAGEGEPAAGAPGDFMDSRRFGELLDRIAAFSGEAVIDLSLWGELALHPERRELIALVLERPALSLIVETSGVGWKTGDFEALAAEARRASARLNRMAPLSWIVSLDTLDPGRYQEIRGPGYGEAREAVEQLGALFPGDTYVQAVRVQGAEDDVERFYRHWKEGASPAGVRVIIQKYDHFAGALPALQASDLSPVRRRPCWHLLRDLPVLLDGTVPLCREDLAALEGRPAQPVWGNVFTGSLESIWSQGEAPYREHCRLKYTGICADCDEYYTYNS
jgi:spiro-SPASM protein